ncbi:VWA domain-containing protein [Candidatus Entotheonella palauensis]|uniref:VWA domain-containing protein n=1 Tax=Candidatus Entotheonella palauensis TaxID=93172 RepID=UPI000B7E086F|nr:VWA domain-containing protein [Candidatus Entotheonella palauensis]
MSLATPWTLLLLVPALGALIWLKTGSSSGAARLPGHWHRVIEPALQPFMARYTIAESRPPIWLMLSIWTLLVLALAQPSIDTGTATDYANLAGRVMVLDLGAGADIHNQRLAVIRLIEDAPEVPTAIVVATSESFEAVPMTTDRAHLERYLQAIEADVMPVDGRFIELAAAHSEALLTRAEIVAGQVVMISGGTPPARETVRPPQWPRALVVADGSLQPWRAYANQTRARLTDIDNLAPLSRDLNRDMAWAAWQSDRSARRDMAPWLIGSALGLWLGLFRRRRIS